MVIGLVGKTCSGKNIVASYFEEKGFYVIDVDVLGHIALEENHNLLVETFGSTIEKEGKIDRKQLGPIVFSDPKKLETLNNITHPWMVERVEQLVKDNKNTIINAALLESMGLVRLCDEVIWVFASKEIREQRALSRDNISQEQFEKRNLNQINIGTTLFTNCEKVITIVNDSSKENLLYQLDGYYTQLKAKGVF